MSKIRFTRENILEEIQTIYNQTGRIPTAAELSCGKTTILRLFGGMRSAIEELNLGLRPASNRKDLIGKKFGRLIVIGIDYSNSKIPICICECICGKVCEVRRSNLTSNGTQSCGCLKREFCREQIRKIIKVKSPDSAEKKLYSTYKFGAKDRNYSFDLSLEDFKILISGNCFYCGEPPKQRSVEGIQDSFLICNGIDRVDNNLGYLESNCVACCTSCNYAKRNHSQEEFISWIRKVYLTCQNHIQMSQLS